MDSDDKKTVENNVIQFQISSNDAYDLLKIRAAQEVEKHVFETIKHKYRTWFFIVSGSIAVAGFFGYNTFSDYISKTISDSVERVVKQRVEKPLLRLEGHIDKTIESGMYAKYVGDQGRETMSRIEYDAKKTFSVLNESAAAVQENLSQLQDQLNSQNMAIERTRSYMTDLITNQKTEIFISDNTSEYEIIPIDNNNINNIKAIVILRLENIPIAETIRLQFHLFAQPPPSYDSYRNIVFFGWGDNIKALKDHPIYIYYSADSQATGKLGNIFRRSDGIYAGNIKIISLPIQSPKDLFSQINNLIITDVRVK